jgi:transcription elongation factor/antiterminator RfaH
MEWFALYVKSRHEFITNKELLKKGFETFLPSVKKLRYWKDRKKFIDFPLFPGYLFVNIYPEAEEFLKVLKTRGVVTFVSLADRPTSVEPEEISSLKVLIESGKDLDIYPNIREGTLVRIKRGVLKGAEGVLEKKGDQYIFQVNIRILGRSVSVKIPADDIECA